MHGPQALELVDDRFGTGPQTITWWQMVLRAIAISDADLLEALRSSAGTDDLSQVRLAYLERSGRISFVRR